MKSTLGQSTPIGPSVSINFQVGAGFWYQDPVAPSAISDLTATLANRSVNDIILEWSHAADNVAIDHFIVFRGTDPSFTATGGDSIAGTKGTSSTFKAADPSRNLAEDSNRAGKFDSQMSNGAKR
jgi:hypothetical protein